jgi:UDP-N-acetyl-D-galactosamine dehydrogenase
LRQHIQIGIIGLGYVGLPVAIAFFRYFEVLGYDSDSTRIVELRGGRDGTNELELASEEINQSMISFSNEFELLQGANFYCVCVPTPIDGDKKSDLGPLEKACRTVASVLARGDIVVFESTASPGATKEVIIPLLEQYSGLQVNDDFAVGCSPETINSDDFERKLKNVVKLISATFSSTLKILEHVFGSIVKAGLHQAPSIKVAEAVIRMCGVPSCIFDVKGIFGNQTGFQRL